MYIVTGGAGLIGSATAWGLNQRGINDILLVDHLGESDKWQNLRALKFNDYMEKDVFREAVGAGKLDTASIDAIIHLGACSSTTETDASYLIDNNFGYTKELAMFAAKNEIHFIYASSCATYGDGSVGYKDSENELELLRPLNMYGYSKHLFDLWAKRNGLLNRIVGLKFSNVFGPNERHKGEQRSVVSKAFDQIVADGRMRLFKSHSPKYADGEFKRDFLYVKDAVDMILFLTDNRQYHGIYNIGSGRAETWNSLAAAIFDALELPQNIEYVDMPEHFRDRYQYYTKAPMDKFRALGYRREAASLNNAVTDYIRNYLLPGRHLGD